MFTGIVKELGKIVDISRDGKAYKITVGSENISKGVNIGDSVSVNGVCLTAARKNEGFLYFDAVEETIRKTSLSRIKKGDKVNLEDALRAGDPIGGHFVLGHVDCTGEITGITNTGKDISIEITVPEEFSGSIVEKGSAAIDGISLTLADVKKNRFRVYIIPHTLETTTLGARQLGDELNIEFDILGKYVRKNMGLGQGGRITEDFLREKGFA